MISTIMAVRALILPGIIPEGEFRAGLWLIVPLFSLFTIYSFLWGAQRGHWVRFVSILIFFFYSAVSYYGAVGNLKGEDIKTYIVGMMLVPVLALILSRKYKASFFEEYRDKGKQDYFDIYFGKR